LGLEGLKQDCNPNKTIKQISKPLYLIYSGFSIIETSIAPDFFKSFSSAFVPIMFEMTVFFAAHLMVITFYMRSKLWPFKKAENPNPLTTDDKFHVEIELHDNEKALEKLLKKSGAIDVSIIEKPE
jgi:hypothetical protein